MWVAGMHRIASAIAIATMAIAVSSRAARADTPADPLESADDADLYRCHQGPNTRVSVQFKPEMDVQQLVSWVMGFTCKNFVVDPRVVSGRKVTIVVPTRMTAIEAYQTFLVALSTIHYTVVPKGRIYRVVDSVNAKHESVPLLEKGTPGATDRFVRYVYRPTYAQPESLLQAFDALESEAGEVKQIGSLMLLTDYSSHVRDMLSLAHLIDVPQGSDGIYLLPVQHADATKLVDKLETLLGRGDAPAPRNPQVHGAHAPATTTTAPATSPSKILVDERTNTLIVAGSAAAYERVKALVERIDIPLEIEGGASIHVYPLGSSVAEELAKTLQSVIQGPAPGSSPTRPTKPGAASSKTEPSPAATDTLGATLEGDVRIIADKPTNSLIVMSSGRDYLALKEVIRQLDIPKRQVYIEVVILEVGTGSSLDIGTSSHGGIPGTNMLLGGVQLPSLSSLSLGNLASSGVPNGLVGALIGKELKGSNSLLGQSIPSYGVLFQALGSSDRARLVSAPSIIGVDNEESKHKTGINVAYQTGTSSFQNGGVTTQQNIERKPLDLELAIKPHVFQDDQVLLELKVDSENLGGEDKLGQPIWTTRNLDTRVVVRDQQTVAIGSLTQDRETSSETKVPLLGDLPLLGYLFKYSKHERRKTTLIVMLTPYIIKDHMDLQHILDRKLREADEFTQSLAHLEHATYTPKLDYRRKRGLVEEINRSVMTVEAERTARSALHEPSRVEPGAIDIGRHH